MRILVIDDNAKNLAAARKQLEGHDVTFVSTFVEARKLLDPTGASGPSWDSEVSKKFGENKPKWIRSEERGPDYWKQMAEAPVNRGWDVVLTDLMMPTPAPEMPGHPANLSREGELYPFGLVLVLLALWGGTPRVGLVSTHKQVGGNHHEHRLLQALESLEYMFGSFNASVFAMFVEDACPVTLLEGERGYVKDWKRCLEILQAL